jgi:hypothetical protein
MISMSSSRSQDLIPIVGSAARPKTHGQGTANTERAVCDIIRVRS